MYRRRAALSQVHYSIRGYVRWWNKWVAGSGALWKIWQWQSHTIYRLRVAAFSARILIYVKSQLRWSRSQRRGAAPLQLEIPSPSHVTRQRWWCSWWWPRRIMCMRQFEMCTGDAHAIRGKVFIIIISRHCTRRDALLGGPVISLLIQLECHCPSSVSRPAACSKVAYPVNYVRPSIKSSGSVHDARQLVIIILYFIVL